MVSRCEVDMLKIKSEFKRKYGKSLYYFIQVSFFSFRFISVVWIFAAVLTGFIVPLEFMGGVVEAVVRALSCYLCIIEKPTFNFAVYSWYNSWQPPDRIGFVPMH